LELALSARTNEHQSTDDIDEYDDRDLSSSSRNPRDHHGGDDAVDELMDMTSDNARRGRDSSSDSKVKSKKRKLSTSEMERAKRTARATGASLLRTALEQAEVVERLQILLALHTGLETR
jgi:hypothetical protein